MIGPPLAQALQKKACCTTTAKEISSDIAFSTLGSTSQGSDLPIDDRLGGHLLCTFEIPLLQIWTLKHVIGVLKPSIAQFSSYLITCVYHVIFMTAANKVQKAGLVDPKGIRRDRLWLSKNDLMPHRMRKSDLLLL